MPNNNDIILEILTDMNGRVGSLQHAAQSADSQRQVLFDKVKDVDDRVDQIAMQMNQITSVAAEIERIKPTIVWLEKTKHRAAGIIAGFTLAASALGVLMGDAIRALFRSAG